LAQRQTINVSGEADADSIVVDTVDNKMAENRKQKKESLIEI